MARVLPDPEDEGGGRERQQRSGGKLDDVPVVTVLGIMDGNMALRFGWKHGMHVISNQRFKFMKEDLELNIIDNPDEYLF
jgi:hypothetical protein